jgi:hypothetical protein
VNPAGSFHESFGRCVVTVSVDSGEIGRVVGGTHAAPDRT